MKALLAIASLLAVSTSFGLAQVRTNGQPEPSCTMQMRARPFTTQADAKRFGRACLLRQGAQGRRLTRAEVLVLLEPVIGADHPLAASTPADIGNFCPAYPRLAADDRALVWRTMLAAMARPESNFQAAEPYWEVGQRQYSIGLLQLSLADEAGYRCGLRTEVDLTRPEVNLSCGTRIMTRLIARDGRVGGDPAHLALGGARYWSTLRERQTTPPGAPPADARDEIIASVRALPFCS